MSHSLTTAEITGVFTESVQGHSGRVTEVFDDGARLFIRSLLPHKDEVRPQDEMQGGLALNANEEEICLHPYLFRQVCRNVPVTSYRTVCRDMGHWEDCVVTAHSGCYGHHKGCGTCNACCAHQTVVQRRWVPNIVQEQVPVTTYRQEVSNEPYEYQVTVHRAEPRTRTVTVYDYQTETRTRTVNVVHYRTETRTRTRKVCDYELQTKTRQVAVHDSKVEDRTRTVNHTTWVPVEKTRTRQVTTWKRVPEE